MVDFRAEDVPLLQLGVRQRTLHKNTKDLQIFYQGVDIIPWQQLWSPDWI
jgi:hypothetical protein